MVVGSASADAFIIARFWIELMLFIEPREERFGALDPVRHRRVAS